MHIDRTRLVDHSLAIVLVAAAVALRAAILGTEASAGFLLSSVTVAGAAWLWGMSPAIVATLTAVLAARVLSHVDAGASLVFLAEGLLLAGLAAKASQAIGCARDALASANARISDLVDVQRRLRRSDAAFARLDRAATDCAALMVDDRGRIIDSRDGAARLFGWGDEAIVGESAAQLFVSNDDRRLEQQLAAVSSDGTSRFDGACRRADGTTFDADVEIHRIDDAGARAYVLILRDRSRDQQWRMFVDAAADREAALREEADVAQRQLATLQSLTDPALNLIGASEAITVLLDRLREAVDADGVALVRTDHHRPYVVSASDGLQPDGRADRRYGAASAPLGGRILIVHNDPARVAAVSAAAWRGEAASLIAVPVVSGSHIDGTIEVVGVKTRRSTEWEIALAQVVAAQIAGRLHDNATFGADAVA